MEVGGKLYVLTALCQRRTHLPDLGRQLAGLGFGVSLLGNGMTQIVKQARKNIVLFKGRTSQVLRHCSPNHRLPFGDAFLP